MVIKTETVGYEKERLLEDYIWEGVTIPKGFTFDGASTPRIFYAIIPPYKRTKKAALVHDWLCSNAKCKADRKEADRVFYRLLKEAKLSRVRCIIGYIGVRIGSYMGIGVYY